VEVIYAAKGLVIKRIEPG